MGKQPFIDFQGRKIIVTGASSGIGHAISVELSRHGATLILLGRNLDTLMHTASMLESKNYHILQFDLTEFSEISNKVKDLSKKVGRIYGVCHAAGIVETRPLSSCSVDGVKAMMDINLIAGIELTRIVCRRDVMEQDAGAVLFISSIYSLIGMPGEIGYSASKGAVKAVARTMAIELARRKIRVNSLSPGLVHTNMSKKYLSKLSEQHVKKLEEDFPLGVGAPEDVARAAAFLLSPQSSWITGTDLVIDGGYTAR